MAWAYSRLIITGMYIKWIGFDEEDDEEREVKLMDDEGCWRMGSDGDTKRQRDLLFNTKIPVSPRRSMAVDTEWIGSWSVSRFRSTQYVCIFQLSNTVHKHETERPNLVTPYTRSIT